MTTVAYTDVPPLFIEIGGQWYIEVVYGEVLVRAPVHDGAYYLQQVVEKLAVPALRAAPNLYHRRVPQKSTD